MDVVRFEVPGEPVQWHRAGGHLIPCPRCGKNPRLRKGCEKCRGRGFFEVKFQVKEDASYQNRVALCYRQASCGLPPWDGMVGFEVIAVFPMPKSMSKTEHREIDAAWPELPPGTEWDVFEHTVQWITVIGRPKNPDLSNIIKNVEDGLKGIAWLDDRQIVYERAFKVYGPQPAAHVKIKRMA